MTTAGGAAARGILIVTSLLGLADREVSGADPAVTVELQVFVHASMDAAGRALARDTALALLASAGIVTKWRECASGGPVCRGDEGDTPIVVLLLPQPKLSEPAVCGEATRDGRTSARTVLIYVPRHVALAEQFRSGPATRSHPALATVEAGHLVGLTIAHEVGHLAGLQHAEAGVMKARPNQVDVIALRAGRLGFDRRDAGRMRRALQRQDEVIVAEARP